METQKIQATITLTLTTEQLLMLLNAAPTAPQAPAQTQILTPAPAPQPLGQMFPSMPTAAPAPMQTPIPMQTTPQTPPPVMPTQTPPQPQPMQQTPAPMPTAQPQTYSVQELGLAARPLMENGRQQELIALIAEFGVPSIAAIPENRRTEFAARLRALGGQI